MRSTILMSFGIVFVLLVSVAPIRILGDSPPPSTNAADPDIAAMISKIDRMEIYKTIYDLTNFTTRYKGTAGNTNAATYLHSRFSAIPGLTVAYQDATLKNVVATLPSGNPANTSIFVIGAHYDSYSYTPGTAPGATDDAGGCAIVLEFARVMSQYSFNSTIRFCAWNGEETGLQGSDSYATAAKSNGDNIALYLNYDSACYDPFPHYLLDLLYNTESEWVKDMEVLHNTEYSIGFSFVYNVHASCGSDHDSFWAQGYLGVSSHTEYHGAHYHQSNDTVEKANTQFAKMHAQLGMTVIAELAGLLKGTVPEKSTAVFPMAALATGIVALIILRSRRD